MPPKFDCRVLYLEDRQEVVDQVILLLKREYLSVDLAWVRSREAFESALQGGWGFDLLFLGSPAGPFTLDEALATAEARLPDLPAILLPDTADDDQAAEWLRQGAVDCVPRSGPALLAPALRRALRDRRAQAALREAQADSSRLVALLRSILESTAEGILVVDLAGKITAYNRKFMSLCGVPEYVMAPMELDRILRFLQDQFLDPDAFMNEARNLGGHSERRSLGLLNLKNRHLVQAFGRGQRMGSELVGRVFSFQEVAARDRRAVESQETSAVSSDLLAAAREGRVVPWYLTEDELVLSEKALPLLELQPDALPRDLPGLEALIHPDDLDQFRQGLEHPHLGPFSLRLSRGDGTWIQTRWNLKRGTGGYRGIFTGIAPARGPEAGLQPPAEGAGKFNYKIQVLQEEPQE